MADLADVFFRSGIAVKLDRIHPEENVSAALVLFNEPVQKWRTGDCVCGQDALHRLSTNAIPDQHGDTVFGRMEREDILRGGKHLSRKRHWLVHGCFRGAT